jgi:ferredoxin
LCEANVPDVFEIDDEGKVVVIDEHPAEELRQAVTGAVHACPSFAIQISDQPAVDEGTFSVQVADSRDIVHLHP